MKQILTLLLSLLAIDALAQSLAINTTGASANASSILDVSSTNKGILIPRVSLTNTNDAATIPSPANSLIVYNTNAAMANGQGIGVYFNYGTPASPSWTKFSGVADNWYKSGNSSTSASVNFIGTTDFVDLVFRTNNTEAARFTAAQRFGIGVVSPATKLEVSSGTADAIYGHSTNIGGYLGYETNFSFGSPVQNLLGSGVYATNSAAGYTAGYFATSGAATVSANINYSNVWQANYNLVDNASNVYNPNTSFSQLNVTNAALGGTQIAIRGLSERGATTGNPGYSTGIQGVADAQFQDAIGVQGISYSSSGGVSTGGYFEGLNYAGTSIAYAYVGGWINGVTARKIIGTGTVSEIIPTPLHGRVTLTAPESPEYWYQDYGTAKLVNGKAHVDLDPILADIIFVNNDNPLRVFCTPVDMENFNGVTIKNRTETGFDIVELNGGMHTGTLEYQLVAKPRTNYGEGRFPQAPGPAYLKASKEPQLAKAKNQPRPGSVYRWKSDWEVYGYNPEDMVPVGDIIPAGPHAGTIKTADGRYIKYVPADKQLLIKPKTVTD